MPYSGLALLNQQAALRNAHQMQIQNNTVIINQNIKHKLTIVETIKSPDVREASPRYTAFSIYDFSGTNRARAWVFYWNEF